MIIGMAPNICPEVTTSFRRKKENIIVNKGVTVLNELAFVIGILCIPSIHNIFENPLSMQVSAF